MKCFRSSLKIWEIGLAKNWGNIKVEKYCVYFWDNFQFDFWEFRGRYFSHLRRNMQLAFTRVYTRNCILYEESWVVHCNPPYIRGIAVISVQIYTTLSRYFYTISRRARTRILAGALQLYTFAVEKVIFMRNVASGDMPRMLYHLAPRRFFSGLRRFHIAL